MVGIELSPHSAHVRPQRLAMFHARAPANGELVGVLVGVFVGDRWEPALTGTTLESVIVHGVKVHLAPFAGMIDGDRVGWLVSARVRAGQTLVVYVRNDRPGTAELRSVLVVRPLSLRP